MNLAKIKEFVKKNQKDIVLILGVVLISLLSFAMGYLAAKTQAKEELRFESYEKTESGHCGSRHCRTLPGFKA